MADPQGAGTRSPALGQLWWRRGWRWWALDRKAGEVERLRADSSGGPPRWRGADGHVEWKASFLSVCLSVFRAGEKDAQKISRIVGNNTAERSQ